MFVNLTAVGLIIIVGFLEMQGLLAFAARINGSKPAVGINQPSLREAHNAFIKGNHLSQFILKDEDKYMKRLRRIRLTLCVVFVLSIFLN